MSTKKDKFTSKDRYFMQIAINLAVNRSGYTGSNPSVGCVVVKNNDVVSFGSTNINGRPHAETIALNNNKKSNKGATVYVTLEPCSHYGKTPPCTKALIKSKVKKVIYSVEDNDSRSFKKSKKILTLNKIITKLGLLKNKVNKIYKKYNFTKKNNFPYITGKLASSHNLLIEKGNKFITNQYSRMVSHQLRSKNQGLLTSYITVNTDNPKLNCRINGLEKFSPIIIVIDKDLQIKLNSLIFKNKYKRKVIIFHNAKNLSKIKKLKTKGVTPIYFKTEKDNYFDLKKIFKKIYKLGIHSVLVECGSNITRKILLKNLFNEFYFFRSNKMLNNRQKINVLDIKSKLDKKFKNKDFVNRYLDKDKLMHYY